VPFLKRHRTETKMKCIEENRKPTQEGNGTYERNRKGTENLRKPPFFGSEGLGFKGFKGFRV